MNLAAIHRISLMPPTGISYKWFTLVVWYLLSTQPIYSQIVHSKEDLPTYLCQKISHKITIDGIQDVVEWKDIPLLSSFVDLRGPEDSSMLKTKVKMCWDSTNLYVIAHMDDDDILATMVDRDDIIYKDDAFEIIIDPDGDGTHYYEFEWNALNAMWDLMLLQPYRIATHPVAVSSYNAGVESAVQIHKNTIDKNIGWSIEVAIPWASILELQSDKMPKIGDIMRMNVCRVEWPDNNTYSILHQNSNPVLPTVWAWAPTGKYDIHIPYLWGYIQLGGHGIRRQIVDLGLDEQVKLQMWDIYWQVEKHHKAHKEYSVDPSTYDFKKLCEDGPSIFTTSEYFEIRHTSCEDPTRTWILNKSGKIYLK